MRLEPREQIEKLESLETSIVPAFSSRLPEGALTPASLSTLQVNVGKMCNQTCKHCHVDAGPTRKEIMSRETMELCLRALDQHAFKAVDLTGGAPEMNPYFRWFVEEIRRRKIHVMVRCNLTIIEAHEKYADLPEFFAKHEVEVISSLPSYSSSQTDRQRGNGVFNKSISALKKLNAAGYGQNPALKLNLVYNPNGAFLPGDQTELEREFKSRLKEDFGIVFNQLYVITNMPIARFLEYLVESKNFAPYMQKLSANFNPMAVPSVMCRSLISVSWDGRLYDCDFNQMLELDVQPPRALKDFDAQALLKRKIKLGQHCYGCTAGTGSSCGGSLV